MEAATQIELIADTLEKAAEGIRGFRGLIEKILGNSPEGVRETLQAMEGLTPAQIRDALRAYREPR